MAVSRVHNIQQHSHRQWQCTWLIITIWVFHLFHFIRVDSGTSYLILTWIHLVPPFGAASYLLWGIVEFMHSVGFLSASRLFVMIRSHCDAFCQMESVCMQATASNSLLLRTWMCNFIIIFRCTVNQVEWF